MDDPFAAGFRANVSAASDAAAIHERQISDHSIAQFIASDIVVIGALMYNFSIPTQLKAWLDRLALPGKAFKYIETGPVGLAEGKRVIIVSARGGFYVDGAMTFNATARCYPLSCGPCALICCQVGGDVKASQCRV